MTQRFDRPTTVKLNAKQDQAITMEAERRSTSKSQAIREIISDWFQRRTK